MDGTAPAQELRARSTSLRFGIIVSRRQARRAVARNMVKRILRESARHAAQDLSAAAGADCLDILFRLKSPLPDASAATWSALKGQLRCEADALLQQLRQRLGKQGARAPAPAPPQVLAQSADGAHAPESKSAGAQA